MSVRIDERRPADVARVVERLLASGCRSFVLRAVAAGGMLDRERLGAARYAAGGQAQVSLEGSGDVVPDESADVPAAVPAR